MGDHKSNESDIAIMLNDKSHREINDQSNEDLNDLKSKFEQVQSEVLIPKEEVNDSRIKPETGKVGLRQQGLIFTVDSIPPWYITFLYALQQVLSTIGGPVTAAFMISSNVCGGDDQVFLSDLIGTSIFMSGVCTLIQVTFGIRLPIIQGSTLVYLPVILSLMSTPKWKCPEASSQNNGTTAGINLTLNDDVGLNLTLDDDEPAWKPRMREVSGALVLAASVEVIFGCTGAIGLLMKFIGPLTIAPAVAMIGFSLTDIIANYSSQQWGVSMSTTIVFILVSTLLKDVQVPFPVYNRQRGLHAARYPAFRLFPPIFAFAYGWILCYVLTVSGYLTKDPEVLGYRARTDVKTQLIVNNKWFFFPYPGMWGAPTFSAGVFVGMLSATISSMVESVGDYYATARACGVAAPPKHAMNRGIAMEGLGSVICGLLGAGHATTSYSQTIGFVPLTGMGSRVTWQVAGIFLICAGVFGKFGAVLSTIPEPVLGGILTVSLGMVISVGLSNIQFIDLRTGRNMMILGTSFLLGLMIPRWIRENLQSIATGYEELDQMSTILLGTPMFIGGLTGCILDNVLPGTLEERGMIAFRKSADDSATPEEISHVEDENVDGNVNTSSSRETEAPPPSVYDLPFLKKCHRHACCTYVPFLPCYRERSINVKRYCPTNMCCVNCKKRNDLESVAQDEREMA